MTIINVCCNVWAIGGFETGFKRLSKKLPQYKWIFTTSVIPSADLVIYANDDKFYYQAKKLNIDKIIFRYTGPRSYGLKVQSDISAIICSSLVSYNLCKSDKKLLIYNGIDFEYLKTIKPISCSLLYGCARFGRGQRPEIAIQYAIKNNQHLTITGARQHLAENYYDEIRAKYPQVHFTGLLDEDTMLGYVKGCKAGIMPTSTHGLSNFVLELVACDKPLINIGNVEQPSKDQIDINITAQKYSDFIKSIS